MDNVTVGALVLLFLALFSIRNNKKDAFKKEYVVQDHP